MSEHETFVSLAVPSERKEPLSAALNELHESVQALTPGLAMTIMWTGGPRCWRSMPTDTLRIVVGGETIGTAVVGRYDMSFPLVSPSGEKLWNVSEVDGCVEVGAAFQLVDDNPSPYEDGRSRKPWPLDCDLIIENPRLSYDTGEVARDMETLEQLLALNGLVLEKQRMLHAYLTSGRRFALAYLLKVADDAEQRSGKHGRGILADRDRNLVGELMLIALREGVLGEGLDAHDADTAFEIFESMRDGFQEEARSYPAIQTIHPASKGFGVGTHGWSNAEDYRRDIAHRDELVALMETLGAVQRAMVDRSQGER